ncbi:pilus assembly protein TadG-related protein [Arthrobacter sp. NQ4]|uniref:pilus assembly protein TadG-related protein n=1 Tax=Arthrobacter sp. NQ4 TaxID=3027930 RepID=UPI0023AEEAAD|nr:pilus assembly protein TadG-related protein [Arthrobacter sp. NQ4]MDE8585625.1 pilus assembly protein TadG-related protein [Arthrobacter sp. NQ4]
MRGLNRNSEKERGATAVMVAVMMVMLLSFGAIAVDVGGMYAEKAVTQNGADAAALAVAQKCSKNTADPACVTGSALSGTLANANAKDNLTNVASTVVDKTAGKVTVTTNAQDSTGVHFSTFFARIFGTDTTNISAVAEAKWGGAKSGDIFPIAFSECEVDLSTSGDGAMQFLLSHGTGAGKKDTCHSAASGLEIPGGFGWLVTSGTCTVKVDLASPWVASNTGNNPETGCGDILQGWKDKLIAGQKVIALLPVFDQTSGTGTGSKFHLRAFAAIDIAGWDLANQDPFHYMPASAQAFKDAGGWKSSDLGIVGKFVRYVALDEAFDVGGPTDYGGNVVELTK